MLTVKGLNCIGSILVKTRLVVIDCWLYFSFVNLLGEESCKEKTNDTFYCPVDWFSVNLTCSMFLFIQEL